MPVIWRGGSTLSMQLARMYKNTPSSPKESILGKTLRKMGEWGLGPIIHWKLTHDPLPDRFKRWAANHLPMIQRHGGNELYGIGLASEILFNRTAQDLAGDSSPLSIAQQYVLAAAVNQPVGLLPSQDLGVETISGRQDPERARGGITQAATRARPLEGGAQLRGGAGGEPCAACHKSGLAGSIWREC